MNDADLTTGVEAVQGRRIAFVPHSAPPATGILMTGYFINIAPATRNGVFYAMLAAGACFAVAAMGSREIAPMRLQRKKLPGRILPEEPCRCERTEQIPDQARERAETWKQETQTSVRTGANKTVFERKPFCPHRNKPESSKAQNMKG